jgi:hypothetical protein
MIRAALLAFLLASPALAQQPPPEDNCGPRTKVIYKLANQFLEAPIAEGLIMAGQVAVFEWWGNPRTMTWSLLRTTPDGKTCIIAAGVSFAPYDWRHPDEPL